MQPAHPTIHPGAVTFARRAVTDTELAASLSDDMRLEAWNILLDTRRAAKAAGRSR